MFAVVLLDALVENRLEQVEEKHVDREKGNYPYHNDDDDLKRVKMSIGFVDLTVPTHLNHSRVSILVFALAPRAKFLFFAFDLLSITRKDHGITIAGNIQIFESQ